MNRLVKVAGLVFVAGLLVAGGFEPRFSDTTFATYFTSVLSDANVFTSVAESWAYCAAFWSSGTTSNAMDMQGRGHTFNACLHSNGGLSIQGRDQKFNEAVTYATVYSNNDNGHTFALAPAKVTEESYPWTFRLSDYAPGGCKVNLAAYKSYAGATTLSGVAVTAGIHYVNGDLVADLSGFTGAITLVASGTISITYDAAGARPAVDGLLAYTTTTADAGLAVGGGGGLMKGLLFAQNGKLSWSANGGSFDGQMAGARLHIAGQSGTFTAAPPIGHQACA